MVKGLVLSETLGKGTFGYVKLGTDPNGKQYALKFLLRDARRFKEDAVKKEIDCMKRIKHPNVVNLLYEDYNCDYPNQEGGVDKTVLMVLEYAPGGDLYDILFYAGKLSEKLARTYFIQLMHGLDAIHKAGVTHRDLKANNVLLDHKFRLKITDFGLSHIYEGENPTDNRMKTCWVGTKGYQAPELILNRPYTNKCDIFSSGVVVFTLLTGHQPFKRAAANDPWYKCIAAKKFYKFWKSHSNDKLSDNNKSIIEKMLAYQPRDRWTIEALLDHEWCKEETYDESGLQSVMKKLHQTSVMKKKSDLKRAQRIQKSQNDRALDANWVKENQDVKVPVVDFPLPIFGTYLLKEEVDGAKMDPVTFMGHCRDRFVQNDTDLYTWIPERFCMRLNNTAIITQKEDSKEVQTELKSTFDIHVVSRLGKNVVVIRREFEGEAADTMNIQHTHELYDKVLANVKDFLGDVWEEPAEALEKQFDYSDLSFFHTKEEEVQGVDD